MTDDTTTTQLSEKAEKNEINRTRYVKNLADRYENQVDGFQNEVIQNAIDAYDRRKDITNAARIKITVRPEKGIVEARDNSGGMPKETADKFLTFEDGEKFGKEEQSRGSRGQGGAVLLALGDLVEIETLHKGERTTAKWTAEEHEYGFRELQQLQEEGTIFRVKGVKEEYIEDLKNVDKMERLIRKYWQKSLERDDIVITYEVKGFGTKEITPYDFNEDKIQERVTRTDIEGIDELEIIVFKESRPSTFSRILALNVLGHTIEWKSPQRVNSSHRVLAFAELPSIKDHDKPSHRGFQNTKKVRKITGRVKEAIRSKMDEYRDLTQTSQSEDDAIQEELEEINDLISETEEVSKFFTDSQEGPGGEGPTEEKENLYPKNISTRPADAGEGDKFEAGFDIVNPKGQGYDAKATIEFLYPLSKIDQVDDQLIGKRELKDSVKVKAGKTKSVGTFHFEIPEQDIEGRYRIRVKVTTLYPKNEKTESTTGWIQVGDDQENPGGNRTRGLFKSHQFSKGSKNWKREFSDDTLFVNVTHPRFYSEVHESNDSDALRRYVSQAAFESLKEVLIEYQVEEVDDKEELSEKIEWAHRRMDELESEHLA